MLKVLHSNEKPRIICSKKCHLRRKMKLKKSSEQLNSWQVVALRASVVDLYILYMDMDPDQDPAL